MVDKRRVRKAISLSAYPLIREFLGELAGTFVLVLCIIGTQAQAVLTNGRLAEFLANRMGEGFGVMAGVWIAGGVSGAHLNPALSFALACTGKLQWRKLPVYWIAQYLGAFAAAACVFAVYLEAIFYRTGGQFVMTDEDPGFAAIFAPYPSAYLSMTGAIVDSIVGSALLLICASAIVDQRNCKVPVSLVAFYMGFAVMGLGISFSMNCGVPINPARDLSPRLFTYLVGWGQQVFSYNNWMWFWIPLVIPHFGAVLGAFIYIVFVDAHWPA
ncbi:aquaporin-10 [Daphnia magna]|uniref:Aquaporin-10 n=3 Tax=Daphnia magna TaxID=35525 RepID=A0A0P6F2U7_9CRUS|nr:aquaporin-10 [Daphnia magna]KAK4020726.1 hypothetical protein OUZ56_002681 [Daphnia magna]KZS15526.1 Uncharacterized protein APZ42_018711 [Daphnia magna]